MNDAEVLIKFKGDTKDAEDKASGLGSKLSSAAKAGGAAMAAIGTAAATATKKLWDATNAVAQTGDEIDKTSQKVGMSTEAYQKWDYAMKIAGTSMQNCTVGLKTMTNKIDDALSGNKNATEAFERLGISIDDLKGKSREDIFEMATKGLQNLDDSLEKAAIANDLFGRSGQDLMPLFNATNEELDGLMQEAEDYGMVMSDDAVKSSAAFQDSLTKLQGTLHGVGAKLVSGFMPGVTDVVNGFSEMIAGVDGGEEKFKAGFESILTNITTQLPKIVEGITAFAPTILDAIVEVVKSIAELLSDGDTMQTIIDSLINGIIQLAPALVEAAVVLAVNLAIGLVKAIPQILAALPQIIGAVLSGLAKGFGFDKVGKIGLNIVKGIWNGMNGAIDWVLDKIKGFGKAVLNGIKAIFGIHSPSKVMANEIGQFLPKGIAVGIEANTDSVTSAMGDIQKDILSTFDISPQMAGIVNAPSISPITNVEVYNETDPLGQMVSKIKTFSGGSKNDYNYGYGGV